MNKYIYVVLVVVLSAFLLLDYVPGLHDFSSWVTPPVALFVGLAYLLDATETGRAIGVGINGLARKSLTVTLFFIGASLSRDVLKAVGVKPLIQGVLLWLAISLGSLAFIYGTNGI